MSVSSFTNPEQLKDIIEQLENSGTTFSIEFVGTVSVNISLNSSSIEHQIEIGSTCINSVAKQANRKECSGRSVKDLEQYMKDLTVLNVEIDLNVTTKSLLVIETTDRPKILYKFDIQDISLVVPGSNEMIDYFCFFAKTTDAKTKTTNRKCLVFYAGDEKPDVCTILALAFRRAEQKFKAATPSPSESNHRSNSRSPLSSASSSAASTVSFRPPRPSEPLLRTHDGECSNFYRNPKSAMTEKLHNEPWYHGLMNRTTAESLVTRNNQFLVRESERMPNEVILTGMQNNKQKHIRLIYTDGRLRTPDKEFRTVSDLVNYYMNSQRPLASDDSELILAEPVTRR